MKILKLITILLFVLVSAASLPAQKSDDSVKSAVPDLSGNWILSESKSLADGTKLTLKSGNQSFYHQIVIRQELPKITLADHISIEAVKNGQSAKVLDQVNAAIYYTDGRGETNDTSQTTKSYSLTKWAGNKLVISFYSEDLKNPAKEKVTSLEFELSKDGQTLNVTTKDFSGTDPNVQVHFVLEVKNRKDVYKLAKQ